MLSFVALSSVSLIMLKVNTNISLDADLKSSAQQLVELSRKW